MADDELAAIRAQRIAQLQDASPGASNEDSSKQDAQQRQEEMRNRILQQVLSQEARARLSTIAAAKPEKGAMIEQMVVRMAQMNQGRQISEQELIGLLEKVSEQTQRKTKVTFNRRRAGLDSDDDDW
ncbi:Programmed cell death protein 5-like [Tropilaelaps mercedesae]|uniref:Programmed cell death protein 5-like n=1 Tax=Tropilaelaps mercedesae TaxID=418985 RepID=A0A1V9XC97_9ACAR|nr:Programmed cell death protein 5-like [Tropilaelaps mercedesae]